MVAVEPARMSYGAYLRLPVTVGDGLAATQARRMKLPGMPRVIVIFHPLQYPLARGLIAQHPDAELWYWQWDRFEAAYDATPRQRERLQDLHVAASLRASVNIVVTDALGELVDPEAGAPQLIPLAADSFPAPDPGATVVAVSLGHLGHRTDWKLLRAVAEGMPELVLLLIGEWHEAESGHDEDFQACRAAPNLIWLGRRSDEEAARLIACADVGIVPFERSDFNDTGLPYRILKYARLGRRDDLAGPEGRAHVGARGHDRGDAGGVDHRAARARGRAGEARRGAARVGLLPVRARAEPAAVGADRGAGDRERAAGVRARQTATVRRKDPGGSDALKRRIRQVDLRVRPVGEPVAPQRLLAQREDLDAPVAPEG